jgi:hypothetical protein
MTAGNDAVMMIAYAGSAPEYVQKCTQGELGTPGGSGGPQAKQRWRPLRWRRLPHAPAAFLESYRGRGAGLRSRAHTAGADLKPADSTRRAFLLLLSGAVSC